MANTFPTTTVASLPSASANIGKVYNVTDAISETDVTVGHGGISLYAKSNGINWYALKYYYVTGEHVHPQSDIAGLTEFTTDAQLVSLAGLSFTGGASKFIRVNAGETAFELATVSGSGTVTNTGTLTANAVIIGNGGTDVTALASLGTSGWVLTSNGPGVPPSFQAAAAGSGDVVGPASATDKAITRFNSTTGKLIQNSIATLSDTGDLATTGIITATLTGLGAVTKTGVEGSLTGGGVSAVFKGVRGYSHATTTGGSNSEYYGLSGEVDQDGGISSTRLYGIYSKVRESGTVSTRSAGVSIENWVVSGGTNSVDMFGIINDVFNFSSTSNNQTGILTQVRSNSTVNGVYKGLSFESWSGSPATSYGIYMDTSIDRGTTTKYAIYSLSTSPSLLTGDLTVSGLLKAGSGPTTLTDATGKLLSAGSDTQVQFNDSGVFGGDSQFTFNKTSGLTTITASGASGAATFKVLPGSGTSSTIINDNGTMVLDADVSTGSIPLLIKYNGGTIWTFNYSKSIIGASGSLIQSDNYQSLGGTTGLKENATAVWEVNNGTSGQWGSLLVGVRDAGTTTVTNGLTVGHQSTGTPAAGLGSGLLFRIDSSTTADQNAGQVAAIWTDATHASRTSKLSFSTVNNAGSLAEGMYLAASDGFLHFPHQRGIVSDVGAQVYVGSGSNGSEVVLYPRQILSVLHGLSGVQMGGTTNRDTWTFTCGTVTEAGWPLINATGTWNASGVTHNGIKLNVTNTASAAGSRLLDLQLNGSSVFAIEAADVNVPNMVPGPYTSQRNRVTLVSTDRAVIANTGRLDINDPGIAFQGTYSPGSFTLLQDEFVLQYKRLILSGNARATLQGSAEIIITSFQPVGRLVLSGSGGIN